jgi:integrase
MKGSIRERRPKVWNICVELPPAPGGQRRQKNYTVYGAKRDAQRRLREILTELDQGKFVQPGRVLVSEYLTDWLDRLKVSLATEDRYRNCCTNQIIPHIGHLVLSKLTTRAVEDCYAELAKVYAPRTIRLVHRTLVTALNAALKGKLITENPAIGAERPTVLATEARFLEENDLRRVLDKMKAESHHYPAVLLAATTGLRIGEIAALQWSDLDLKVGKVSIRRNVERLTGKGLSLKDTPKTKHGRRTVTMPKVTTQALRRHRWHQYRRYQQLGLRPEFVFPNPYGELISPAAISQAFGRHCRAIGIDASIHSLRHTHAAQLIADGIPLKVISDRLGHSSIRVTADVYGHLIRGVDEQAADLINERFV